MYEFVNGESMAFRERTRIVFGENGLSTLANKKVAVFGLGGVGAAAAMDLVRSGIGTLILTDFDDVSPSNLNRLIVGFSDTVGENKAALIERLGKGINPDLKVIRSESFMKGSEMENHIPEADYYIDAIDSLNPKINLIIALLEKGVPFVSSMGTGGRMDPTRLNITDIWKTEGCPLASFVRKRLRKRGVRSRFPVVFSNERPVPPIENREENHDNLGRVRKTQGSTPFVPQVAGHIIAYHTVKTLLEEKNETV